MTSSKPPEAERDQDSTAFTPILRRVWSSTPSVLAVAFADTQGECIDYASSLDPFDAKVSAAHGSIIVSSLLQSAAKLGGGVPISLELSADLRELWARRVSDEYVLVVVTEALADREPIRDAMLRAVAELRAEAGIPVPGWDQPPIGLRVETRAAVGWAYAPAAYEQDGVRTSIAAVIGRWLETGDAEATERVCFLVRTERDEELTLVHDPLLEEWNLRGAQ